MSQAARRAPAVPLRLPEPADGSAPAAVFFTSGTTGTPKAVVSPHRATTRLFGPDSFADFGPGRVMSQTAPVSWDAFGLELWGMLTTGGTAVLPDGGYFLPDDLAELVTGTGLDTVWLTAALFNLFVDEDPDCFTGLRQVLTGGERMSVPHARTFLARHPDITLLNGYGPVECCVFVTTHRVRPADCEAGHGIPLGTAVPGTGIHVLDGATAVPPGTLGEICVSGEGLADGYLGDEAATAAGFTTFDPGGGPRRIYRTGDLGRLDDEGVLHFHGRADRQVKISGHRVEPAETEAAPCACGGSGSASPFRSRVRAARTNGSRSSTPGNRRPTGPTGPPTTTRPPDRRPVPEPDVDPDPSPTAPHRTPRPYAARSPPYCHAPKCPTTSAGSLPSHGRRAERPTSPPCWTHRADRRMIGV